MDGMDGLMARKLNTDSTFGEKFDTRADYITFGFAPSFLIYQVVYQMTFPFAVYLAWATCLIYFYCVHYRLQRFQQGGHSHLFEGIPSPVAAGVLAIIFSSTFFYNQTMLMGSIIVFGFLMVSRLAYPHTRVVRVIPVLKQLRYPSLVLIALVVLMDLGVTFIEDFYIAELLLVITVPYILAPCYVTRIKLKGSDPSA